MADAITDDSDDAAAAAVAARAVPPAPDDTDAVVADLVSKRAENDQMVLRASLNQAVPQNSDKVAKIVNLSDATGVPPAVVERNESAVAQQQRVRELQYMLQSSPVLALQMRDPQFAALAHDDAENLHKYESVSSTFATLGRAALRGLEGGAREAAGALNLAAGAAPVALDAIRGGTDMQDWYFKNFVAPHYDRLDQINAEGKSDTFAEKLTSSVGRMGAMLAEIAATGGAGEAPQAATAMKILGEAGVHAVKSMWLPATIDAANAGKRVYEATGDSAAALKAAEGQYVATTGMGMVPLSTPGGLAARAASGFVSGAVSGEASRQVSNATLPEPMRTPFSWEDDFLSGVTGSLMGAVLGPRTQQAGLGAAIRKSYEGNANGSDAERGANAMQQLFAIAGEDKLRENSPANFSQFAQAAADEHGVSNVFVDAKTFAEAAANAKFDVATHMPETAKQLDEALTLHGDLSIPMGELTTAIPGTGMESVLLQNMRMTPDGPTLKETQDKAYIEDTQKRVQQILDEQNYSAQIKDSASNVEREMLAQHNAVNRFTPEVNKFYAKMDAAFATVMGQRIGLTPEEFYVRYPREIRASGAEGENVMSQQAAGMRDALAEHDDLFRYPISHELDVGDVARDIDPGLKVHELDEKQIAENTGGMSLSGLYGQAIDHVFEIRDPSNDNMAEVIQNDKGEVWINISQWKEGTGGSSVYAIVGDYAKNNGLKFIGDPNGLSKAALFRRTEAMASSALRHGTTEHLEPHSYQVEGDASEGVKPLPWAEGAHEANTASLLRAAYDNVAAHVPEIDGIDYHPARGEFIDRATGKPVGAADFQLLADQLSGGRAARAGPTTIKRAIVVGTLLRQGVPVGRSGLLGEVLRQSREQLDVSPAIRGLFQRSAESDQTQSPEFKKWFGDSKVVDAEGKPLVVYHGTPNEFTEFDIGRLKSRNEGPGFYFTTDEGVARGYGAPLSVYLSIKNPMAYDAKPFKAVLVERLLKRIARLENEATGGDIRDGFLANFGDTYAGGIDGAVREGAKLIVADKSAVDQISGIVGAGVPAEYVLRAVTEIAGHDGIVSKGFSNQGEASNTIYVAFRPEQIKSAIGNRGTFDANDPNILHQDSPVFYSAMQRQIEAAKMNAGPAAAWKDYIRGLAGKGVKAEEVKWSGIDDWLDAQQGKVTKQQVAAFLEQGGVKVEETMLGEEGAKKYRDAASKAAQANERMTAFWRNEVEQFVPPLKGTDRANLQWWGLEMFDGDNKAEQKARAAGLNDAQIEKLREYGRARREYIDADNERQNLGSGAETKFGTYTLPGGENYRELLLTLPPTKVGIEQWKVIRPGGHVDSTYASEESANIQAGRRGDGYTVEQGEPKQLNGGFRSSHFEQPNILAHVRFNERTDAEGKKVLFIEEIQSDWAQKGKREGFKESVPQLGNPDHYTVTQSEHQYHVADPASGRTVDIGKGTVPDEDAARSYAKSYFRGEDNNARNEQLRRVPSAPFVGKTEAWVALALKRMIRYAAENGFERVAWTNGEQQAARYDLSKQVDAVYVKRNVDGTYNIGAMTSGGVHEIAKGTSKEKLEELIGKNLAEQASKQSPDGFEQKYEGADLKVGGEGMRAFYDKIVPNVANDVLKKLGGGKVGDVKISEPLTAEERAGAPAEVSGYPTVQPGFDITPKMREGALEGQPLFQESQGGNRGQIAFGDDITKTPSIITLLQNADLSTYLHESGHFYLEVLSDIASRADAPADVKADMDTVLKWFGISDNATWRAMPLEEKRQFHEQFARAFEQYLMEGKSPNQELASMFSRFRAWLLNVYKSASALNVTINPEIRAVFDRMLASNTSILEAERARHYEPMYKSAEEMGATPEEWKAYTEQNQTQTQDAVDQLQTRSLRDMKWLSNAKSRILKSLQREAASKRKNVQAEVTAEVRQDPVYAAQHWLKTGEVADKDGELIQAEKGFKLNSADLKTMYPDTMLARPDITALRGMTSPEGLHPDLIAPMFGFTSGDQLVRSIIDAPPERSVIEGKTDQAMLERYGDLNSPQAIEQAADEAVSNEAHLKMLATELRFAEKAVGPRKTLVAAAKETAAKIIAAKKVKDIKPAQYVTAESKARAAAQAAHVKGDREAVVREKQIQLVNAHAAKLAYEAVHEINKGVSYQARFDRAGTRNNLDVDIRDQIDDLRERFDFRKKPTDAPTRAQTNLKDWIEGQIAAGYTPLTNPDMLNPALRTHYADLSMEQFRGFIDTLKSLAHIGRERQNITLNGERADLNEYVKTKLVPKMQERGERFTKTELLDRPEERHTNPVAIALAHFNSWRRAAAAQLKPQEFKRNEYDRHELLGPFGESLFEPVINANYRKVTMLRELSNDFAAEADKLGREWQDSLREAVTNTTLLDPDKSTPGHPVMMNFTRGKMLGLAIHVGNESNFNKAVKGWGWEPAAVWKFLHDNMTAKDWQAVQTVWDLYEKHWPEMEAMNRRLGNTSPDKIEPRPFKTKFGDMKGGYAAITYDALRSRRGEKEAAGDAINPSEGLFGRNYFRADTTTNGSLNKRVDSYTDRVDLDFHGIARKMNETIHDLAYREALIDANKVIEHPEFRSAFKTAYGPEAYKSLRDWLGQLANSNNLDRTIGALGKFLQYTRTGMVMNAIAFRATTVLKHGGSAGVKTMGYFLGGGEKYLASRFAAMGTNYTDEIKGALEKFGEIRNRLQQQDRDFKLASTSMFEPESLRAKGERFGHATVAWADMMTAIPTAWAAYDRAVTEGVPESQGGTGEPMTEAQAINYANKIVREAHGTTAEAARSMVMNNQSEAIKMFTTLYNFMNNAYGQQLDAFDKLRTNGISNAPVLARTFMAILVPALWAGYISQKKDVNENWATWIAQAVAGEVAASVPFVRDAYGMVAGYHNAGMVAAENWLAAIVLAGKDIASTMHGESKGAPIKDIANAAGTALHIPGLGQLGASAQYVEDVHTGKKNAHSAVEYATGVVTGH